MKRKIPNPVRNDNTPKSEVKNESTPKSVTASEIVPSMSFKLEDVDERTDEERGVRIYAVPSSCSESSEGDTHFDPNLQPPKSEPKTPLQKWQAERGK